MSRKFYFLIAFVCMFFSWAHSQEQFDSPDLSYEAYLHNIYQQFYSQPMADSQWESLVGSRTSESYGIQGGDSLWGLSQTFFGDGNYWPKIWSVNSRISNPHLIEPGNSIRFILGTESEAPAFAIMEADASPGLVDAESFQEEVTNDEISFAELEAELGNLEDDFLEDDTEFTELEEEYLSDEEIDDIVIPPPTINIIPIAKNFPPSLPAWQSISDQLLQSMDIDIARKEVRNLDPIVPLTYYVDENQPEGVGKVVKVESGNNFGAEYQYVYVRVRRGTVEYGKTYLVVGNMGPLVSVYGTQEFGVVHEVQGLVRIGDKVEATDRYKSKFFDVYRAKIINTLNAIDVGSELYISDYSYTRLDSQGRVPKVSGMIVGGEYANKRNIVTSGSLVYVNRGSTDGLKVGDVLPIYANNYIDDDDPYTVTNSQPTGLLKVARVSELYTTGYIVESSGMINIGDFVGVKENFERNYLGTEKYEKLKKERKVAKPPLEQELLSAAPPPVEEAKGVNNESFDDAEFLGGDFELDSDTSSDEELFDE